MLLASTRDSHWQIRYHAVEAVDCIAGSESPKHIEPMLDDGDGAVRSLIHRILFQRTGQNCHLQALEKLLADLSTRARRHAVKALLTIGTPAALMLAARGIAQHEERETRAEFIELLAESRRPEVYSVFLWLFGALPESDRPLLIATLLRSRAGAAANPTTG